MKDLKDKVAVITGGASGIGLAVAKRCAAEGMKLVLADIEEAVLDVTTKELSDAGATVVGVPTDVSELSSMEALLKASLDAHGAVHLVHLNAGVAGGGLSWEIPMEVWHWVLGVNLFGVLNGIHTFVPHLVEQGEGHVVNTASVAGLISAPGIGPYNASKHAVVTVSETLIQDLRMSGSQVGVSVLCPAFVRTRIHEADRNAPKEVADATSVPTESMAGAWSMFAALVEAGIPVEGVADAVVDAVKEDRFYILTHPETRDWIRERVENMLAGGSPGLPAIELPG